MQDTSLKYNSFVTIYSNDKIAYSQKYKTEEIQRVNL